MIARVIFSASTFAALDGNIGVVAAALTEMPPIEVKQEKIWVQAKYHEEEGGLRRGGDVPGHWKYNIAKPSRLGGPTAWFRMDELKSSSHELYKKFTNGTGNFFKNSRSVAQQRVERILNYYVAVNGQIQSTQPAINGQIQSTQPARIGKSRPAFPCPCGGGQSCIVMRRMFGDWVHEDGVFTAANLPLRPNCRTPYSQEQRKLL